MIASVVMRFAAYCEPDGGAICSEAKDRIVYSSLSYQQRFRNRAASQARECCWHSRSISLLKLASTSSFSTSIRPR